MSNPGSQRKEQLHSRAQEQFQKVQQRDTDVRKAREKEQNAVIAKTAKLKALRLAKEAEDKLAAEAEALANPPRKKTSAKAKGLVKAK